MRLLKSWMIVLSTVLIFVSCNTATVEDEKEEDQDVTEQITPEKEEPIVYPSFNVTSTSFESEGEIAEKYCFTLNGHTGENISPQLSWDSTSDATSYLILMDDGSWSHWVLYNIPGTTKEIAEDFSADTGTAKQGKISSSAIGYEGPYPPSGNHRYDFKVYSLDIMIDLEPAEATRSKVMQAIDGHILSIGQIYGTHAGH